jgi:hypothetical protein
VGIGRSVGIGRKWESGVMSAECPCIQPCTDESWPLSKCLVDRYRFRSQCPWFDNPEHRRLTING